MPTAPALPNPAKTAKFPTHLAISGDALLGSAQSANCVHDIEATIYDHDENAYSGTLNMWARDQPAEGLYILNNVPCATGPFRLAVTDSNTVRLVPEEVDGSSASGICLPPGPVYFTGVAVLDGVDADRKGGTLTGWTYMGKKLGWVPWTFRAVFENAIKWNSWYLPPLNTLVAFEVLLHRIGEDGTIETLIRRMSAIEGTGAALMQSVGGSSSKVNARGAMLKEMRLAKKARATTATDSADGSYDESSACPPAPKANKAGITDITPPSPTPLVQTRKRGRIE
ncbi:hypothetical protein OC834_005650 [Tilletia horrida]|nr:hypothetical protein OC834_005650 [Tilletia horrida]KAK0524639.1 hypothetical protein OC835_005865 [Tilletia horrida]KAK0567148.1 hypothetical protein OC844_000393 [Tilletia horrida]